MVKQIVKDTAFLSQKSVPAGKEDLYIADDLRDTLRANQNRCVGMAANMIGYKKNMIVVSLGLLSVVMINPKIISKKQPYQTQEGCLSLDGVRNTTRYKIIEVEFQNQSFEKVKQEFTGHVAQIIQHECDHLEGILI